MVEVTDHIKPEGSTSSEAFALDKAHLVRCPVLIMHGRCDDRMEPGQAERFAGALTHAPVKLCIFENEPHTIDRRLFVETSHALINEHMGTQLTLSWP